MVFQVIAENVVRCVVSAIEFHERNSQHAIDAGNLKIFYSSCIYFFVGQFQVMKPDQHTNGNTSTGRESYTGQSSTGTGSSSRNTRPQRKRPPLVTIRIDNEDSLNMDLSCIDASVVDSENLSGYCQNNLSDYHTGSLLGPNNKRINTMDSCAKNRLSCLDTDRGEISESEFSDGELFRLVDRAHVPAPLQEEQPLVPKTVSEENSLNLLVKIPPAVSTGQKGNSTNMIEHNNVSNSKSELTKDDSGHDSSSTLHSSTPNIKFKAGGLTAGEEDTRESHLCSMPNLAFDPESPDSEANEKPPPYPFDDEILPDAKAGNLKRTNSDMQTKFDPHRYNLSTNESSKC